MHAYAVCHSEANDPKIPLMAHMAVASAMNNTLLNVLGSIMNEHGGILTEGRDSMDILIKFVVENVDKLLPQTFDAVAEMLDKATAANLLDAMRGWNDNGPVKTLLEAGMSSKLLHSMRFQMSFHLLACLGGQCVQQRSGPSTNAKPYLVQLVRSAVDKMKTKYSISENGSNAVNETLYSLQVQR